MLDKIVSSLNLKPGHTVLDATIGGGGHAIEILDRIKPGGKLIGLDADASAVSRARGALGDSAALCILVNENFRNLDSVFEREGIKKIDACLFDVGISSFQMDDADRGFSFQRDARLDMRMDPGLRISAWDIVNKYREEDLSDIIYNYGEERFARRVARYIVNSRAEKPIDTTGELRSIVHRAVRGRRGRIDPATRTFQALRIAVNDELGALDEGLKKAIDRLSEGGRIAVISFHSLEDRIVKNIFKSCAASGILKIITRKPITASEEEKAVNPRSRSAKLRIAERVGAL
ncbi:MAG: 16S rRNA (cytosine(1402)-N(4))-methyltransferase RsmH [Candidatus Omnitrophica bacterium]|nr:16S rRNA (cytosine(1402)-N(4))-methyltransferase RsmH [Candidatus Omnitrophota bacterium]